VFDDPFQSLNPVLEHALKLLKSDADKQICQCLDHCIHISKSPILQCYLGPSKELEVVLAQSRRIKWMGQSLDFHSANCLQYFRSLCTRQSSMSIFIVFVTVYPVP
jgi:hypothetical protein